MRAKREPLSAQDAGARSTNNRKISQKKAAEGKK
jgi:hypothetical protein